MNRGAALHWGGARQGALRFAAPAPEAGALRKVISGGEAGVDRAALDAALALGYTAGGWCRRGRARKGRVPDRVPLRETSSDKYPERAALNVRDADATLIVYNGTPDNGTRLTQQIALRMGKPVIAVDLDDRGGFDQARDWLARTSPRVLNVAGAAEARNVGVYARTFAMLVRLLGPARTATK